MEKHTMLLSFTVKLLKPDQLFVSKIVRMRVPPMTNRPLTFDLPTAVTKNDVIILA